MNKNVLETVFGAVVLAVAGFFIYFAYTSSGITPVNGYVINANFNRIDGLQIGNEVRLGGIKVGSVVDQKIDSETYQAHISLNIDAKVKLPKDTSARVLAEGLLGDSFVDLQPGGDIEFLENGDFIEFTQDSVNVVDLLGRFIFSLANSKDENKPQ